MKKIICLLVVALIPVLSYAETSDLEGPCSGSFDNYNDTYECVQKAEYQGTERGYDMDCEVQANYTPDPDQVLTYSPVCTVNGSTGHGAYLIVGMQSSSMVNPSINPGWDTLARELASGVSGSAAGGSTKAQQTTASYLANLTNTLNSIINTYKNLLNLLNRGTISTTYTPAYTAVSPSASTTPSTPTPTPTPAKGTFQISPAAISLNPGVSYQFIAWYDPDGSGPQPVQAVTMAAAWSSSGISIAKPVSFNPLAAAPEHSGQIQAVSKGVATITAQYQGLTATAAFTVN